MNEAQNLLNEDMMTSEEMFEFEEKIICVSTDWKGDLIADAEEFGQS